MIKLVLLLLLIPGTAFGYEIQQYSHYIDGPPLVCVWDNKYSELFKESVNVWNTVLYDKYGEDGEFQAFIVTGEEKNISYCTIHIVLVEEPAFNDNPSAGFILGITFLPEKGNDTFIFVYEDGRIFANEQEFNNSITRTILHEMGHAFGMSHWMPENVAEALMPHPTTLMWEYQFPGYIAEIDEYTLDYFNCIYGANAWKGENNLCENPYHVDYLGIDLEFTQ